LPSEGFEPATSTTDLPQAYALDRSATGVGVRIYYLHKFVDKYVLHGVLNNLKPDVSLFISFRKSLLPTVLLPLLHVHIQQHPKAS
jgi:hypothetical protein